MNDNWEEKKIKEKARLRKEYDNLITMRCEFCVKKPCKIPTILCSCETGESESLYTIIRDSFRNSQKNINLKAVNLMIKAMKELGENAKIHDDTIKEIIKFSLKLEDIKEHAKNSLKKWKKLSGMFKTCEMNSFIQPEYLERIGDLLCSECSFCHAYYYCEECQIPRWLCDIRKKENQENQENITLFKKIHKHYKEHSYSACSEKSDLMIKALKELSENATIHEDTLKEIHDNLLEQS